MCLRQDDHKLTLDELNRKYGTDLNNVSVTTFTFSNFFISPLPLFL